MATPNSWASLGSQTEVPLRSPQRREGFEPTRAWGRSYGLGVLPLAAAIHLKPNRRETISPASFEGRRFPYAAMIRQFIETDRIAAARRLLPLARRELGASKDLDGLAAALAPPRVTTVDQTDGNRSSEYEWLAAATGQYSGQWVALEGAHLLAANASLAALLEALRQQPLQTPPLVYRLE